MRDISRKGKEKNSGGKDAKQNEMSAASPHCLLLMFKLPCDLFYWSLLYHISFIFLLTAFIIMHHKSVFILLKEEKLLVLSVE